MRSKYWWTQTSEFVIVFRFVCMRHVHLDLRYLREYFGDESNYLDILAPLELLVTLFLPFARNLDIDDLVADTFCEQVVVHHPQAHVLPVTGDEDERRAVGVFFEWRGSVKAFGQNVVDQSFDLSE